MKRTFNFLTLLLVLTPGITMSASSNYYNYNNSVPITEGAIMQEYCDPGVYVGGVISNKVHMETNKDSALANGADEIILSYIEESTVRTLAGSVVPNCFGPSAPMERNSQVLYFTSNDGSVVIRDVSGYLYDNGAKKIFKLSLKSSKAGQKTIIAHIAGPNNPTISLVVNFNAASASSTTNKTTTNNTPKTEPAVQQTPPSTPVISQIRVGNEEFSENISNNSFSLNEIKIFSGKTIPNGVVRLYFQSDPFEDTTTADAEGNWTYELAKDIGVGEHKLQITVTDPVTNLTSEKSEEIKFTLVAGENNKESVATKKNNYIWYYLTAGVLSIFVLVGTGGYFLWEKKLKVQKSSV